MTTDGEALQSAVTGLAGTRGARLARVERDIRQAQAEALGRVGEVLDRVLARLREADRRLDALVDAGAGAPSGREMTAVQLAARDRLWREAARIRQNLVIQREALGIGRHGPVAQCYPLPARRRV